MKKKAVRLTRWGHDGNWANARLVPGRWSCARGWGAVTPKMVKLLWGILGSCVKFVLLDIWCWCFVFHYHWTRFVCLCVCVRAPGNAIFVLAFVLVVWFLGAPHYLHGPLADLMDLLVTERSELENHRSKTGKSSNSKGRGFNSYVLNHPVVLDPPNSAFRWMNLKMWRRGWQQDALRHFWNVTWWKLYHEGKHLNI